ncbi:MAG: prephenate dehydrogenase [Deltaproteobacteria bacterium]|nr:MAG: prephenate dehydrogenase [Deltaproteobacteria bacterium]
MFNKTVIIGVGLLGSSIGMNLISKKLSQEVIGVGRDIRNLKTAQRRKAIHRYLNVGAIHELPLRDLTYNDLVILAAPVSAIKNYLKEIPNDVLITDVGSVKESILKEAERLKKRFVGSHPISGTEKTGAQSGDVDLFQDRSCIVTPSKYSKSSDVAKIKKLWAQLGSRVSVMSASEHDRLFAYTSHLPHAVAYSLIQSTILKTSQKHFVFSSFRDATRVAASSPEMWRDIFLENSGEITHAIAAFQKQLDHLISLMKKKDTTSLMKFLKKGQEIRQKL